MQTDYGTGRTTREKCGSKERGIQQTEVRGTRQDGIPGDLLRQDAGCVICSKFFEAPHARHVDPYRYGATDRDKGKGTLCPHIAESGDAMRYRQCIDATEDQGVAT